MPFGINSHEFNVIYFLNKKVYYNCYFVYVFNCDSNTLMIEFELYVLYVCIELKGMAWYLCPCQKVISM